MHYSTIEEVWGSNIEKMEVIQQPVIQQPVNNFDLSETTIDEEECKQLIQKIMKSKKCKKYLREKFRPKILEKLEDIIDEYRELVVLILICYAIYLFVSIINDA